MKKYLIVILLILSAIGVFCREKNPHDFKKSACILCHTGNSTDIPGRLREYITDLCEKCHQDLIGDSYMHPVDIRVTDIDIPADFPLSADGMITCNTCHDVHSPYELPDGTRSAYLRRPLRGKAFCDSCHKETSTSAPGHRTMLGEAHFRSKYIMIDPSQEIDPMSKNCISCHDGFFATSVSIKAGIWQHSTFSPGQQMANHPIGVDYEAARLKHGRKTDLKPITMVDRRIQFFDGKVGCGSCHNPFSRRHKNLVMNNQGSKLCLTCHIITGNLR